MSDDERRRLWESTPSSASLLAQRMAWEETHPRPENIRRAERMIVRALVAEGFGRQHQVTHHDRFEIAVDNLLIRVEINPDA